MAKFRFREYFEYPEVLDLFKYAPSRKIRLLMMIQFYSGCRISESTNIAKQDILWEEGKIRIIGKGDKERKVIMPRELEFELQNWKPVFKDVNKQTGKHYVYCYMTTQNINIQYKKAYQLALKNNPKIGYVKKFSTHTLRHSAVRFLWTSGYNPTQVMALLGHANLSTTMIYSMLNPAYDISNEKIENNINNYYPGGSYK